VVLLAHLRKRDDDVLLGMFKTLLSGKQFSLCFRAVY
jgi:hypothetical protein